MRHRRVSLVCGVAGALLLLGCGGRGLPREERQVRIIPDMEEQKKYKAQEYAPFFEDHRTMRTPVEGTVPRGGLKDDPVFYLGMTDPVDTTWVEFAPVSVTPATLQRGRERYDVYCSPCHDRTGGGKGLVIPRGFVPPPVLWDDRVRAYRDGQIFDIISNGIRNMPGYAAQIPEADRWAIVTYVRALQRAQTATLADVPASKRGEVR